MEARGKIKKPSVTDLLDLLNKPALMKWANRIGLQGTSLDEYRKQAKARGTSIHAEIEGFFRDGTTLTCPHSQASLERFLSGKKVIAYESPLETEWFVGRCDLIVEHSGVKYLCDFKSSDGIYLETVLQLAAYQMAEPCGAAAIVVVPEFRFKELIVKDFTPYEEILKALSGIYTAKKQLGWK